MLVDKVRSFWTDVRSDGSGDSTPSRSVEKSGTTPRSKLFRCPDCDLIYLALEKDICSSCRSEVTEVSPTLRNG